MTGYFIQLPERLLAAAVRHMPAERSDWGAAMQAELAQLRHPATRWQFALSCVRVALFPPDPVGHNVMLKGIFVTLTAVAFLGFVLLRPETGGVWLAYAIGIHSFILFFSTFFFGNWLLLLVVTWGVVSNARGQQPWSKVPPSLRHWGSRWGRLGIEVYFGLINPVMYLAIISAAQPELRRSESEWWFAPLHALAGVLLVAIWGWRVCGAAFYPASRAARLGLRALLLASLACLLAFTIKDINVMWQGGDNPTMWSYLQTTLMLCPLYLIPGVLLCDYLRTNMKQPDSHGAHGFLLLTNRAARFAVASVVGISLMTFALAAHRRSETNVRKLVSRHVAAIQSAAARYDVDPRLIAAIVYVTHRDQLSPMRDTIERLFTNVSPPGFSDNGAEKPLAISIGLAQIKPHTAQTASMLAAGLTPPRPFKPIGEGWSPPILAQTVMNSPIQVQARGSEVAQTLLNAESNLETCALILALYQKQWEAARPDWSIRARPDILATLYQIGFAKSKPHGAPRSNAFGTRVREVYEQPWLDELFTAQK